MFAGQWKKCLTRGGDGGRTEELAGVLLERVWGFFLGHPLFVFKDRDRHWGFSKSQVPITWEEVGYEGVLGEGLNYMANGLDKN